MNIFKQDNIQTLRKENQTLRERLRQFKDSDYKKTQELKSKNDEYYALQKELSNTLNRYKNQKADRTLEMADLHEELEKRQNEIDRLNKQLNSEDRDTKNYKREIEINQKEISFLREETRLAKERLAISEEKNVHIQDLHLKNLRKQ
jgi:chromosome segregation ATPase